MRDDKSIYKLGVNTVISLVILPTFKSNANCLVSKCDACHIACAMKGNPGDIKQDGIP